MTLFLILPVLPVFLDVIIPLNESRPKEMLFQVEYGLDNDKYFYEMLFHAYVTSVIAMSIVVAVDSMFFTVVEHACGLFEMVGFVQNFTCQYRIHVLHTKRINDLSRSTRTNIKKVNLLNDRSDNDDYEKICYCVGLHKEALR